jgi:hypothetical protein
MSPGLPLFANITLFFPHSALQNEDELGNTCKLGWEIARAALLADWGPDPARHPQRSMGGIRKPNYLYAVETIDGVGSNAWP